MRTPSAVRRVAESLTGVGEVREALANERAQSAHLEESIADLERRLFEPGWVRMVAQSEIEFTPEAMRQLRAMCRLMSIKDPLIKRGLGLRVAYVWGQGVEITARSDGKKAGEQDLQGVVTAFLGEEHNQAAFTGSSARERLERALGTDGEIFLACTTRPMTGGVQVRTIAADEIADIIENPDDRTDPWYYLRRWVQRTFDADGNPQSEPKAAYYPALGYRPLVRPRYIGTIPVQWDTPVLHAAVNNPDTWVRGIPDAYAAIDHARAYNEFLDDWRKLMKSLARYAWKATTPGNKAATVRKAVAKAPTRSLSGEPDGAGATAVLAPDVGLEAINKSGATLDAESGRPLAMMVASALGVPVTMLLADPGQTGARATAETLDEPTRLEMKLRQQFWTDVYRRLLRYVITEAVRAPQGALKGTLKRDPFTGTESVTLAGDTDDTIDVIWPPLDEVAPDILVKAIAEAAGINVIPPEVLLRLLLQALGVRDVDAILNEVIDDDGHFTYPQAPPIGGAGQAAADASRGGGDASAAMPGGPMTPDEPGEPPPDGTAEGDTPDSGGADGGGGADGNQPPNPPPRPPTPGRRRRRGR